MEKNAEKSDENPREPTQLGDPAHKPDSNEVHVDEVASSKADLATEPLLTNQGESSSSANSQDSPRKGGNAQPARQEEVTVPLAKLQELVRLCAEVLRDSPSLGPQPVDPERGLESKEFVSPEQEIERILGRVKPMTLEPVPLDPDLQARFQAEFSTTEDIDKLVLSHHALQSLQGSQEPTLIPNGEKEPAMIIKWRLSQLRGRDLSDLEKGVRFQALVCCCLAANDGEDRLGGILSYCYKQGVLKQPPDQGEDFQRKEYLRHASIIILDCWLVLNTLYQFQVDESPNSNHRYEPLLELWLYPERTFQEILGLKVSEIFKILDIRSQSLRKKEGEAAAGDAFAINDLNVGMLQSIGNLKIQWTSFADRHLQLDIENSILYILWTYERSESLLGSWKYRCLLYRLHPRFNTARTRAYGNLPRMQEEIRKTWAILFLQKESFSKRLDDYDRIPPPYWVKSQAAKDARAIHLGKEDCPGQFQSAQERSIEISRNKNGLLYEDYDIFEDRLRRLRHYMDSKKPKGLSQLWKDNRDSLNYYTFWGVIIFGGLTVFLAFFSLSIGIAQTVAAFKTLAKTAPPPPTT